MKFKTTISNEEGVKRHITFDSSTSTFYDEEGKDFLKGFNQFQLESAGDPIAKKFKLITLSLGFSCNMSCGYCPQPKNKLERTSNERLDELIAQLDDMDLEFSELEFWGGETTMYIPEIKYVIANLKKHPGLGYHFVTNGTSLNMEMAKWAVENNIRVNVSHDAQTQYIRGKDPLDKPEVVEAIKYLIKHGREFFFMSCVVPGNFEFIKRREWFIEKLDLDTTGMDHFQLNRLFCGGAIVKDLEMNPILKIPKLSDAILKEIRSGEGFGNKFYEGSTESVITGLQRNAPLHEMNFGCKIDNPDKYVALAVYSDDHTCHNFEDAVEIYDAQKYDRCKNCPMILACYGGCPAIEPGTVVFEENCKVNYAVSWAFTRAAFIRLTEWQWSLDYMERVGGPEKDGALEYHNETNY